MTTNPPRLASTIAISKICREAYIKMALEYRRAGDRREKKLALLAAQLERMNVRELLGPAPF
ncbi:hypothetical protein [Cronobacter sakazakii]|uniref:hypothetical protein n=1 Tax=Cronobacter sakazakii TaxID=28141 RepID=UPI00131A3A3D|nr:hypothetical protein [Cronobacter sakazakii]EKY2079377.1 hypothetical protein [Cronobacter sakazakii]